MQYISQSVSSCLRNCISLAGVESILGEMPKGDKNRFLSGAMGVLWKRELGLQFEPDTREYKQNVEMIQEFETKLLN